MNSKTEDIAQDQGYGAPSNGSGEFDIPFLVDELKIRNRYVLFVDVMGMKTTMTRSFKRSAIFMGKFHVALLAASANNRVDVFPVQDGAYVISEGWVPLKNFTSDLYGRLGRLMVSTKNMEECFLIRGGMAWGPVAIGADITSTVSKPLADNSGYSNRLICGFPLILAYEGEGRAAPFGIYIDSSVRLVEGGNVSGIWLHGWCRDPVLKKALPKKIGEYFSMAKQKNEELLYDKEKLEKHEMLAKQYWRF